jgi:hypothetical protein
MSVPLTLNDLTEATLDGGGAFDLLMRAAKAHLEEEFVKNRIKGTEYSTVYLGSMTQVLQTAVQFLLQKDKAANEAALIDAQVRNTEAQILLVGAQTELARQQKLNAENEWLLLTEQKAKLIAETRVLGQTYINAVTENDTMIKQQCKLAAEFDVLMEQKLKTAQETSLLGQKVATEKAQTIEMGVDENSVVGKQKKLYEAQTTGFTRDAEQKAAKLMVDSWNVRRTTDEGTVADTTNNLNDAAVGRAVNKLLTGVGA